jgi:hypothetical protein
MLDHIPFEVDLTEAAKFYGLQRIPPVVYNPKDSGGYVAFTFWSWTISYNDDFLNNAGDAYDEKRFAACGLGRLSHEEAMQFIIAHELYHALQWEQDRTGMFIRTLHEKEEEMRSNSDSEEDAIHDGDPDENAADQHAAQAYKLIKISHKLRHLAS